MGYEGGGGATFLTSDGFQIFFGALYHEMVLSPPEHKGSGNFEFLSAPQFEKSAETLHEKTADTFR